MPLTPEKNTEDNCFNIAFGINDAFAIGAGVCIISILKNNPSIELEFHIFSTNKLSDSNIRKFESIADNYATKINLHVIDTGVFSAFKGMDIFKSGHYSIDVLTRLLIPGLLAGTASKVLYLDADTVCDAPIDQLLRLELGANVIAARVDNTPQNEKKFGLAPNTYFNAGVLLININAWQQLHVLDSILKVLETNRIISLPDQDSINIVLQGKAVYLPADFHYHYFFDRPGNEIVSGKLFIHYLGCIKPWHGNFPETAAFNKYWSMSPWNDYKHNWDAATRLQLRMYARLLFRHHKIWSGIAFFMRYMKKKSGI